MQYGDLPKTIIDGVEYAGFRFNIKNPPKVAVLRLPTPQELTERLDRQKSITRSLGRGKSQSELVPDMQADLALFKKIRVDSGAEFDEYEASNAVWKLLDCDPLECVENGDGYLVTIRTPFGETAHHLTVPTMQQVNVYRRMNRPPSINLPHGQEETRYPIGPSVALYDASIKKIDGYVADYKPADVPPHHKRLAVHELIAAIEQEQDSLVPNL